MEKERQMNQKKKGDQNGRRAQDEQTGGLLGKVPEGIESIAELMLQDSDINVYQQQKVTLKEEAFYIRGKKQKTAAQKQQIIKERQ